MIDNTQKDFWKTSHLCALGTAQDDPCSTIYGVMGKRQYWYPLLTEWVGRKC
jgi:hypothetical protein